jgi:hypothetical protein
MLCDTSLEILKRRRGRRTTRTRTQEKKGITKETREKRKRKYSDLERLSMIRRLFKVCEKGMER